MRGGKRPGAGRKPGAKQRATAAEVANLSVLARTKTTAALNTLDKIARRGKSEAARVSAATAILDRGYGRPIQSVRHGGENGGPIKLDLSGLTDEQLTQLDSIFGVITGGSAVPHDAGGHPGRDPAAGGKE